MHSLDHLLAANKVWAANQLGEDPDFFKRLENQQSPDYFWIGCSDSRVPANTIVNLPPGEVFVHRNVANQVFHGDLNCQAATQFAVEILKVKHIIVCGHYGCAGVRVALRGDRLGLAAAWVRPIHQLAKHHGLISNNSISESDKVSLLCELNVIEQVKRLSESTLIEDAWDQGQELTVHGWLYSLKNGLITNLGSSIASRADLENSILEAQNAAFARYK